MKRIWKYSIHNSPITWYIPTGGIIRAAQMQDNRPTIWCEVDDSALTEQRHFRIYGTGEVIRENVTYIGTVQDAYGFVWHVYEEHRGTV